jgi:galactokinase/mevalonate kinase-like predicted kinase
LAATLLGGLSEFCNLKWDRHEIAYRTLILEQMLTTGGGWQDQFGGIFEGVKLVESIPGFAQKPTVKWASDNLFTNAVSKELILLYYTGINRVAKLILRDIVRGMFLNSAPHLAVLAAMKQHVCNTYETMQNHDWEGLCKAIGYSWELNQQLDSGTNTPAIALILAQICDYTSSYKLLGAGGGGYLLIFAKDLKAAGLIRSTLEKNPPNHGARFVDWEISKTGLRVSRS